MNRAHSSSKEGNHESPNQLVSSSARQPVLFVIGLIVLVLFAVSGEFTSISQAFISPLPLDSCVHVDNGEVIVDVHGYTTHSDRSTTISFSASSRAGSRISYVALGVHDWVRLTPLAGVAYDGGSASYQVEWTEQTGSPGFRSVKFVRINSGLTGNLLNTTTMAAQSHRVLPTVLPTTLPTALPEPINEAPDEFAVRVSGFEAADTIQLEVATIDGEIIVIHKGSAAAGAGAASASPTPPMPLRLSFNLSTPACDHTPPVSPLPTPTPTPDGGVILPTDPVVPQCVFTPPPGGIVDEPIIPLSAYSFSVPQLVVTNTAPIGIQQWLPDSKTLLISRESGMLQTVSVDLVNTITGDITGIVEPRRYLVEPRWLATDRSVIWKEFGPFRDEDFNSNEPGYWIRSIEPPSEKRLSTDGRSGWSLTHDVSPNGTESVFMSLPGGTQPIIWNQESKTLRALPVDLAAWRYYTDGYPPPPAFTPLWNPDGSAILFQDGIWLFLYDLTTDQGCEIDMKALSRQTPYVLDAGWSPNGRYLLMRLSGSPPHMSMAGPFGLVLVLDTYTGEAVQYSLGEYVSSYTWAPDNQTVAVTRETSQTIQIPEIGLVNTTGIYLLNIHNGEYQHILPGYFAGDARWSPDATRLAFLGTPLDGSEPGGVFISQVSLK